VALASSTSLGLMQVAVGLPRGEVLVSSAEFLSNLYTWWRAEEAELTTVRTLPPIAGRPLAPVTSERVAAAVGPNTVAVIAWTSARCCRGSRRAAGGGRR